MKRLRNLLGLFSAARNFSLMKHGAWSLRLLFLLLFCSVAIFVALPSEAATPQQTVTDSACWVSIAAGGAHTIALKSDGTLWAWGGNWQGQLGDGTNANRNIPEQIGNTWASIAAGVAHTIALKSDGTLWAWGYSYWGQLGDGIGPDRYTPQQIGTDNTWASIAAGTYHTTALKSDGTLWGWGSYNYYGQFGPLGDGTNVGIRYTPQQIGTDNTWASIAAGWLYDIALKSDGTLWAWGYNYYGQLGDGTNTSRYTPQQIGTDNTWASISAGVYHTIALKSDGTLWAWGNNWAGQLGDGTNTDRNTPQQIGTDNTWVSIAAGWEYTIALKSDGTLWAWGNNWKGQLGDGTNTDRNTPQQIGTDNTWALISAGGFHTKALKSDGTLWAWGLYGLLGNGTGSNSNDGINDNSPFPVQITGKCGDTVPPVVTALAIPAPNAKGWNNTDVTVTFTCSDAGSGIATCTAPVTVTTEGAGQVITGTAVDKAGNTATTSVTLKVDKTLPTITATATPSANVNGWNNADVVVTFICSDTTSGIATCPSPVTVITEGAAQEICGTAIDNAGNNANTCVTLNIDKTPPVLNVTVTPGLLWPPNHKMVNITPLINASDNLTNNVQAELISVTSSEPDNGLGDGDTANDIVVNADGTISLRAERSGTGTGRVYTITYKATDLAGNVTVSSAEAIAPHDMGKK